MTSDIKFQSEKKLALSSDKASYSSIYEAISLLAITGDVKIILMRLKNQLINFIIFYTILHYYIHTTYRQLTDLSGELSL